MSDQTIAPAADETAGVPLEISDIANAVQVIDFAADQGAFKGWKTIEQVLHVRQRLNAFLVAAQEQQAAAAGAEGEAAEPTETVEG